MEKFSENKEIIQFREKTLKIIEKFFSEEGKQFCSDLEESIFKYSLSSNVIIIRKNQNKSKDVYNTFKRRYNYKLCGFIKENNIETIKNFLKNGLQNSSHNNNNNNIFKELCNKKDIDLFPEKWKESKEKMHYEDKIIYGSSVKSNSSTAKCFKCKEKNVYVKNKQTRSLDEPETIFFLCLTCGNKWRK